MATFEWVARLRVRGWNGEPPSTESPDLETYVSAFRRWLCKLSAEQSAPDVGCWVSGVGCRVSDRDPGSARWSYAGFMRTRTHTHTHTAHAVRSSQFAVLVRFANRDPQARRAKGGAVWRAWRA